LRSERFFDILRPFDQQANELVERWIQAAFDAGREEKDLGRLVCNECTPGECIHVKSKILK